MKNNYTFFNLKSKTQALSSSSSFFKTFALALAMLVVGIGSAWGQARSSTFSTAGTTFWLCPAGVTSITVKCYGGGGGGGRRTSNGVAGGGGGGAYASKINVAVTPGTIYTVVVGAGGAGANPATAGGDSYFNTASTVMAKGGSAVANNSATGANGGQAANCVGDVGSVFSGGTGGTGSGTNAGKGGGGAGTGGAGGNGGTGSNNGTGTVTGGGNGGNGRTATQGVGVAGSTYGGGGGGAYRTATTSYNGGAGAAGAVIIEWTGAAYVAPSSVNMSTGSSTLTSDIVFYDSGGSGSAYVANESYTYTFYPASCKYLTATFSAFAAESAYDYLYVYNGNSVSEPLLGSYSTMSVPTTFTSTASDGSLTFKFTSDASTQGAGWTAVLNNVGVVTGPAQPSSIVGTLDPEVGATETYSVTNVSGVSYAWSFPSGWVVNSGAGTNSVSVTVGSTNGTISVTPSKCSLNGTARTATSTIPNYRWKYISSSLGAATWTGGEARNVSITIQNTGVATWNSTYTNNIGVRWNSTTGSLSGTPWADYFVRTTVGSLAPGATGTFTLAIEAKNATAGPVYSSNLADGNYYLAFDMVSETQCWFAGNTGTCGPGNTVFYSAVQTVSTVPTLSCSALTAFGNVCTNATSTNSFTISGVNLTNNVSVGSVTGYTYSTTSNGTYTSTLTLTPSSGSLNQIVYVKFTPTAATAYSGSISVTSTGATGQSVSVSGTGITAPTVNAGSDFNLCSGQTVALSASTNAVGPTVSTSTSATYSSGVASSEYILSPSTSTNSSCPIPLSVTIPAGATITGVNVSYSVTTANNQYMNENYSYLQCTSTGGIKESALTQGVGGSTGTYAYSRNNLTIANSVTGGGTINFNLHLFRNYGGAGCNTTYSQVNNNTFIVTVNYTYVGNPTYAWSPATGLSATNVLNPSCSTTSTQTYTLTVTGGNGCSASDQVVATVAGGSVPSTPTAAVSGASTINVGGTAILTSTAGANTLWYTTATGGSSVGSGSPFTSPVQCSSGSVTYYAEDNNGTCASNARGTVSFTVRSMVAENPSNALICSSGGSVTLSAQLTGGSSIAWSPNTNLSTTSGASTVASPTATIVYTMSATVADCGSVSETAAVGVIDAVAFTPTSTPASVCAGNPAALASNLSSSGFSASSTTFAMASSSSATPSAAVTLASAGAASVATTSTLTVSRPLDDAGWADIPIGFTYNFFGNNYTKVNVGTNGNIQFGTYNGSDVGGLGDFTFTSLPNAVEPLNIIAAAAVDLNATAGTIKYWTQGIAPTRVFVVEWSGVPGYANNGSNTAQIKIFETTGNVETHIQNSSSTSNKIVGLQNADASIGAMPFSNTTTITNQAWKFVPGAAYTFQWATAGSPIQDATLTGYTTPNLSTAGSVSYSVAATNPNTQCTTTQSVSITVNALPAAPNSSGDVTACSTAGNQSLTVSTGAGETADWFAASTGGTVLASGDNVLSYSTATANTYYAAAQNTTTGCSSASRTGVTLNVNASPAAPTVSTPVAYCQGAPSIALSATATGANTLNWYSAAPSYPAVTGATALGSAPTPSTAATGTINYYVSQSSSANSCESQLALVAVTVNATPSAPVASNPAAYCQSASASALTATSTAGNTLYWYTVPTGGTGSATAPTPSTATAGTTDYYVADRTDASGCEGSRTTVTVTVNPTITASVSNSASSTSACGGGAITFTATPTNGGTPTYQWYLNGNPVGGNLATYTTNQASDNAGNYSGTWNNGSNQGSGMGAWSFTTGANTGQFIGNPSNDGNGTTGIGTTAHGIYASGSAYINTTRGLTTPMQIGDVLRFYWIFNWDANGGNKGFDLRSGGSTLFNVNNGGSAAITVTGGATADANYGTTPMYVEITRTSGSQYTFNMTRRSNGTSYSTTFNSASAIDAISFYIGGQNDGSVQRNLYFNGLEMRPPQANDQIYVAMTPSAQTCLASSAATNSNTIPLTSTAATPTVSIQSTASTAFCPGTSVTFSVNASANMGASPTYQWNLNGTPIGGSTSATLVNTSLANNDQVTLTMTSSLGGACLTQAGATSSAVTSTVNSATAISSQPTAAAACLGGSQNFTVSATGTGTLTYQWKKNGSNVTANATATTATLTLSGIAAGDAADYTVDVTGTCGSVLSSSAALTINSATAISAQPSAVTQCAGTTANFSVTGSGQGTLTYQWRKDGSALNGETNSTLAVTNIATINAGQYSVIVTGGCGNVTSSNALLTVNSITSISTQPAASTLCAGNTANFSVTASGTGALSYQWKRDGNNVGTNSSSLAVSNSQAENAGTYTVDVTGTCGTITSNNALLTVNPLTTISTHPVATSGCEGQNTTFTVVAAGTGVLSYQWKFGGVNISGATTASFNIPSTTSADDGSYLVAVTGGCGTAVNSNTVALNVYLSPTTNATISTADITDATLCGKNTVAVVANSPGALSTGSWSVVGGADITPANASDTSTTFTAANSALGGATKKLVWSHIRETSGNFCYTRDTLTVDFKQPSTTGTTASFTENCYLWCGLTDANWSTSSNWYKHTGNNASGRWEKVTTGEPGISSNVFVLNNANDVCVNTSNIPTLGNGEVTNNVFNAQGAELNLSNGNLTLTGNFTNNGTINPGTGTVTFNGTGAQKIRGSGAIANLNNVIVNKASGTLTLEQPTRINGNLTVSNGNIVTTNTNILEIGSSVSSTGSVTWTAGSILGPIKRWFGNTADNTTESGIFPVGTATHNRNAIINFTSNSAGGYIIVNFISGLPTATENPFNLPISYFANGSTNYIQNADATGYWEITPYNAGGTAYGAMDNREYSMSLRINNTGALIANPVTANPPGMRLLKAKGYANGSHDPFTIANANATVTAIGGSQTDFNVTCTNISGFSFFGMGGDNETPLPVELISFTGFCGENQTTINWKTASEFNSSYYLVEKSTDGENWREVNNQPAAGFSTEELSYQFIDVAYIDAAYYRLTQVDENGEMKVYDPISVGCNENGNYIKTYPNPSDASFQVVVNNKSLIGKATIKMIDTKGTVVSMKEVQVEEGTNLFYLNENRAPGIYYITVSNGIVSTEVIKHSVR